MASLVSRWMGGFNPDEQSSSGTLMGMLFLCVPTFKNCLTILNQYTSNRISEHCRPLSSAGNSLFLHWDIGDNLAEWNTQIAFYSGTGGLCHCLLMDDRADRTCLTWVCPSSDDFPLLVFSGFLVPWLLGHAALMLRSRRKHSSTAAGNTAGWGLTAESCVEFIVSLLGIVLHRRGLLYSRLYFYPDGSR